MVWWTNIALEKPRMIKLKTILRPFFFSFKIRGKQKAAYKGLVSRMLFKHHLLALAQCSILYLSCIQHKESGDREEEVAETLLRVIVNQSSMLLQKL